MAEPTVGAAIITKDRVQQLERLLPQLTKLDQVVVVETGTGKDGTKALIKKLGKPFEYHKFYWRPDPINEKTGEEYGIHDWGFAAARNESFSHLKTDYGIWLDTDDVIGRFIGDQQVMATPEQVEKVLTKLALQSPETDMFFMEYIYAHDKYGNPYVTHSRERLLKMEAGWRWVNPIHEVLLPSRPPSPPRVVDDVKIIHLPEADPNKRDRNLVMLGKWLQQLEAQDPMAVRHELMRCRLQIGETLWGEKRYREAAEWLFNQFLRKHAEANDLEKWSAWIFICKCYQELGEWESAANAALKAFYVKPNLPDSVMHLMQIKTALNENPYDIIHMVKVYELADDVPPEVLKNPTDYKFVPFAIAAQAKIDLGEFEEALLLIDRALAVDPENELANKVRMQATYGIRVKAATKAAESLYQVLHDLDENEKAAQLYDILPYVAQEREDVRALALDAKEKVRHIYGENRDEEYVKLYANNSHWVPVPEEWIDEEAVQERYQYVEARIKKALPDGGTILDVGCSDGLYALRLAKLGYKVVGVDLDKRCVDLANERAEKRGVSAKFVHAFFEKVDPTITPDPFTIDKEAKTWQTWHHHFDAVICGEVIEHVQDPAFLIDSLVECAKDGAPIIITTPDGAFDRGDIPAHGGMHEKEENLSGHVRIYTQQMLEELLKSNAIHHVTEAHFVPWSMSYRLNQGWQVGEIRRMQRPNGPVIRIYCGPGADFNPRSAREKGIGGSETAVIEMAEAWAAQGCQVIVFAGTEAGIYDGVFYRPADEFEYEPRIASDLFIAWRRPDILKQRPKAEKTLLWAHDLYYPIEIPQEWADNTDVVAVLSKNHQETFEEFHPVYKGKTWVTRNGIDPMRYLDKDIPKVPHRYFYSSSLERGAANLLEVWPKIKEALPDAELHFAYGLETAEQILTITGELDKLAGLRKFVAELQATPGIIYHGKINQEELADLQLSCEAWLYPIQPDNPNNGFVETYAITAVEAMAAGCVPISRANGALPETLKHFIEWKEDSDPVKLLSTPFSKKKLDENRRYALSLTWDSLAEDWVSKLIKQEV